MRIALYTNEVRGGWSPLDPEGWSGGEEVAAGFAKALAHRGYHVSVFYDGPGIIPINPAVDLHYRPRAEAIGNCFDIAIHFKSPEHAGLNLAPRLYVWTDQERPFIPDPFVRVVACSQYLARYLAAMVPRSGPRLTVIPYGIDCAEVLAAGEGITRNPLEALHCASPDRGLDLFLELWPRVLEHVPEAKLTIAYGWELYDKYGGSPVLKAKIQAQLAALPAGTWTMGRLSRLAMHQALHRAAVYAYYCTGGEQFGLMALKAQLAGCVPVVKPWGALHETVEYGWKARDPDQFIEWLCIELRGGTIPCERPKPGRTTPELIAAAYDWPRIVDQWEALWAQHDQPAAPLTVDAVTIPGPPPFAAETGWNLPQLATQVVGEWMAVVKPQRPWIDPTLGFNPGPATTPAEADCVLIGWQLEDGDRVPGDWLRDLGIPPGTPVMVMASHGMWRAKHRQRAFGHADLRDVLEGLPEFQVRAIPLDAEGNGVTIATCRWVPERVRPTRDLQRVFSLQAPRETLSACFIVRDVAHVLPMALKSVQPIVDEVVILDTGSVDHTADVVEQWHRATGIPVVYRQGTSPRWCFDCNREHAIGEMGYGHRVAGFETPRNESIAPASGDWILWLDSDEEVLAPEAMAKYLRPNLYQGYGVPQFHHSVNPPEAAKTDFPVRLFRRHPDATQPVGWCDYGPLAWRTYHSGQRARFTGIVHEHPGFAPDYTEGLGPVILLSDAWITHRGYFTEDQRRRRFVRNWPLMVADRQKYPYRRLGDFLWVRDLNHHVRDGIERAGGVLTPDYMRLAADACNLFRDKFAATADAYCADAMAFVEPCMAALQRGIHFTVRIEARKPEVSGEEVVTAQFQGRLDDVGQLVKAIEARLADTSRWVGPYV